MMGALHQPTRARENLAWGFACQVVCQVWIGLRGIIVIHSRNIYRPTARTNPWVFFTDRVRWHLGKGYKPLHPWHDHHRSRRRCQGNPGAGWPLRVARASTSLFRSVAKVWSKVTCQRANIQQPSEVSHFLWPIGNQPCKQFVLAKSTVWM
jgi:hypothetical protein